MTWKFSYTHKDAKSRQPVHEAFFDDSDSLDDVSSLVRESIQNSIDARVDLSKPVKVTFSLSQLSGTSPGLKEQFAGLEEHMKATRKVSVNEHLDGTCRVLAVEDFNTTGLRGYTHNEMPSDDVKKTENFYYFVHAEGDTNKGEGTKGKWGIGKVVFPKISALKTFFLVSVRQGDNGHTDKVGIGQALLKSHKIGDKEYQPDGWFAEFSESKGYSSLLSSDVDNLAKTFGIERSSQTGLSVIIPFVNPVITSKNIIHAVIREYYLAIINDDLVCEITDTDGEKSILTPDSLIQLAMELEFDRKESHDEFIAQLELAQKNRDGSAVKFTAEKVKFAANSLGSLKLSDDNMEAAKKVFNENGYIHIEVPIEIPVAYGGLQTAMDNYSILIRRGSSNTQPIIYSREGILVPGNSKVNTKFATVLVVVDSGPLADLLGFSEGPAHQNWSADTEKIKGAYSNSLKKVASVIKFVRTEVKSFVAALSDPGTELDTSILSEFFSDLVPEGVDKPDRPGPTPPLDSQPVRIQVSKIKGGFRLSPTDRKLSKGDRVLVTVAYGVARGSAFAKWSSLDFTLDDASFKITKTSIGDVTRNQNYISFAVEDSDFEFKITGFDDLRDIELDIRIQEK